MQLATSHAQWLIFATEYLRTTLYKITEAFLSFLNIALPTKYKSRFTTLEVHWQTLSCQFIFCASLELKLGLLTAFFCGGQKGAIATTLDY